MIEDFGESVRPHLGQIWLKARELHKSTLKESTPPVEVKPEPVTAKAGEPPETSNVYTEVAAATQSGADLGEVMDFALKTAASDAFKRGAMNQSINELTQ